MHTYFGQQVHVVPVQAPPLPPSRPVAPTRRHSDRGVVFAHAQRITHASATTSVNAPVVVPGSTAADAADAPPDVQVLACSRLSIVSAPEVQHQLMLLVPSYMSGSRPWW